MKILKFTLLAFFAFTTGGCATSGSAPISAVEVPLEESEAASEAAWEVPLEEASEAAWEDYIHVTDKIWESWEAYYSDCESKFPDYLMSKYPTFNIISLGCRHMWKGYPLLTKSCHDEVTEWPIQNPWFFHCVRDLKRMVYQKGI